MANSKETVKGRLRSTDLIPRILCVILAIIIWLYVLYNSSPDYEKSFGGVDVSITNTAVLADRNLSIYDESVTPIEIVVLGRRGDISVCTKDDISASVDVSSITEPGMYELPISIDVPDTATVKSYYPKKISVSVQAVIEKEVEVVVKPSYSTTFIAGTPTPAVKTVSVKGPASVLESLAHVEARPSFSQPLTTSMTASEVALIACTKSGTPIDSPYIDITPGAVDVDIPIYDERKIPLKVDLLYGYLNNANATITISPSEIAVRTKVVGGKTLESMEAITIATIDETALSGTLSTLVFDLAPLLPEGIEIVDESDAATVLIRHRSTVEKDIETSSITLANPNKVSYDLLTDSLNITFRSSIADSFNLEKATILVEGNISDAENGRVPVAVKIAGDFDAPVYAIGKYYVDIRIK